MPIACVHSLMAMPTRRNYRMNATSIRLMRIMLTTYLGYLMTCQKAKSRNESGLGEVMFAVIRLSGRQGPV